MKYECCGKFRSKTGHAKHNLKIHKMIVNIYGAEYACHKCNRIGDSEEHVQSHIKTCSYARPTRYLKLSHVIDKNYIYSNKIYICYII